MMHYYEGVFPYLFFKGRTPFIVISRCNTLRRVQKEFFDKNSEEVNQYLNDKKDLLRHMNVYKLS